MRVAVIAGELIDANVRLRLTANRTYGLYTRIVIRFFALRSEYISIFVFWKTPIACQYLSFIFKALAIIGVSVSSRDLPFSKNGRMTE